LIISNGQRCCKPLLNFEAWQRENGWWVGEYTFLGPNGDPFESVTAQNRLYDHYAGFIHLEINGCQLKQRNIFIYPSKNQTEGGDEVLFQADQESTTNDGSLFGVFDAGFAMFNTYTTIINDITVLYQIHNTLENGQDGDIFQSQLTTLPTSQYRVRTAQGFGNNIARSASYYRETKVSEQEFFSLFQQRRDQYNVKPEKYQFTTQQELENYFKPRFADNNENCDDEDNNDSHDSDDSDDSD